jgi:TonB family protein
MISNLKNYAVLFFVLTALTSVASGQNQFCNLQLKVADLESGKESVEVKASSAVLQRANALTTISSTLKDDMPFFSGLTEGFYVVVVSNQGYKKTVKKFRLNCSAELVTEKVNLWKGSSNETINFVDNPDFFKLDDSLSFSTVNLSKNLVQPSYPAMARAKGASGQVKVQVTIDEQGNVISADVSGKSAFLSNKARDGYIELWRAAEGAALQSKFYPTYFGNGPVKTTGVIVYNFVP